MFVSVSRVVWQATGDYSVTHLVATSPSCQCAADRAVPCSARPSIATAAAASSATRWSMAALIFFMCAKHRNCRIASCRVVLRNKASVNGAPAPLAPLPLWESWAARKAFSRRYKASSMAALSAANATS